MVVAETQSTNFIFRIMEFDEEDTDAEQLILQTTNVMDIQKVW